MSVMEATSEQAGIGHNSVAGDQLRALIERIERLEEEKANVQADIKDVFAEAKGQGFDTKVMRRIIAERKQEVEARQEFEALLDLYKSTLNMD
jgi:uncharacterized protein (UPF0335 family)